MAKRKSKSGFHFIGKKDSNKSSQRKVMRDSDTYLLTFDEFFQKIGGTEPFFFPKDQFIGMDISLFSHYAMHLYERELKKKLTDDPWKQIIEIGKENKQEIISHMKRKFMQLNRFFMRLKDPIPIYRSIVAQSVDEINMKELGHYWSWDKEHAIYYYGEKEDYNKEYILTATVTKKDVNWFETFLANMHPAEDPFFSKKWYMEREIYLNHGIPVKLQKIEEKKEEGTYEIVSEEVLKDLSTRAN